jgi:hypothetical protein
VTLRARVSADQVTASYFRTIRARIERGRPFTDADDAAGAPKKVVISHGFWTRRLDEDANVRPIARAAQTRSSHCAAISSRCARHRAPPQ